MLSAKPRAEADNTYRDLGLADNTFRDLDYLGYQKKTEFNNNNLLN